MAVIVPDLIDISLAESTTGWSGNSGQLDTEVFKQGGGTPASYTWACRKNTFDNVTFTPAANINMTANYTTPHLYWAMRCDVFPFCTVLSAATGSGATNASGLMVRVTDGTGNYAEWHVDGKDTWDGGWKSFVLDLTNTANLHDSSGTLSLADVDIITWYVDNSNSGNIRIIDNTWMDAVRYGEGLSAASTGTTAFGFQEIADDDALLANWYGALQEVDGVLFSAGKIVLGDLSDTNDCNFVSVGETVYFKDRIVAGALYGLVGVEATSAVNPTDIDITALVCKTVGATGAEVDFSDTDITSLSVDKSTFIDMGAITFALGTLSDTTFSGSGASVIDNTAVTGSTWNTCGQITLSGTTAFDGCTFIGGTDATGAVLCSDLADFTNNSFVFDTSGHGIQIDTIGTYNFTGNLFTGYAGTPGSNLVAASGSTDAAIYNTSGGLVTINVLGGGDTPSVRNGAGATTSVVVNPVALTITAKDSTDNSNVEGAAVTVRAATTGDLPFETVVTITRSGSVATVTHTGHGYSTGHKVEIENADQNDYNRIKEITVVDANSYTFVVAGTPTTPATGTILSTAIIIDGLTNASGVISDTRTYSADQAFTGSVKKGTSAPVFVSSPLSDTLSKDTGFSATVLLIPD